VAQLRRFKDEFERLDAQVLLISFGEAHWARAWQQETEAPFPLLLDSTRAVYRAYDLESSFVRVWSPKVMWHYTRRVLAGQRLQSIQGDPHQLGGDFVVDADGVIRLAHRSRDPVDRPAVETLLAAIKETRPWP
jgi:peroxiredoxin